MRIPFRIRPLFPAILGGLIVTIAGFYAFGRLGGFSNPVNQTNPMAGSEAPQIMALKVMNQPASASAGSLGANTRAVGRALRLDVNSQMRSSQLSDYASSGSSASSALSGGGSVPITRPFSRSSRLIRTATMNIDVRNVDQAVHAASAIADGELGDIINLDYRSSAQTHSQQTASMEVRVPQYRFEHAMDALSALGSVTSRTVSAQDVADQIVDAQARLRNLRHTEADLLKIMDRYGDIDQVLRVTQELSQVREQIETLDAQLQGMQYQVAYSTITINFATPAAVAKPPAGIGILGAAWHAAMQALERTTLGLLSSGLWLVAFSPYVLLLGLVVYLTMRRVRVRQALG